MGGKYDVGYKKPPKSGQFKKGKSGNPKGRKKGTKGFNTIVKEILGEPLPVTQGGVKQFLTAVELALKALVASAAKGNPKAIDLLLKLGKEHLPLTDQPDYPTITLTPDVMNSIEFFEKLALEVGIDESEFGQEAAGDPPPVGDEDLK